MNVSGWILVTWVEICNAARPSPPLTDCAVCLTPEENLLAKMSPVCIFIRHCPPFSSQIHLFPASDLQLFSSTLSDICQISAVPSLMLNLSLLFASFIIYLHSTKRENDVRVWVSSKLQPNLQCLNNSMPQHHWGKKNLFILVFKRIDSFIYSLLNTLSHYVVPTA